MPRSQNERKRAERERYRQAGLKPVQVWVRQADCSKVQQYAQRLNRRAAPLNGEAL